MEKQSILLALIITVAFMAVAMFVLYSVYKPLEAEGTEAVAQLVLRSLILYAAIMVVTILLLLIAFWVQIYVLKPKFTMQKIEAQEWVVKGEVQIDGELGKVREFISTGNIPAAETAYRKAVDIYNWLQDYEMSERKKQDYYLKIDKAKAEIEGARILDKSS